MKIFLTGATGYIGSVVSEKLKEQGYDVLALARTETSARQLQEKGYDTLKGDLSDTHALSKGASESDGVIHTAQMRFESGKSMLSQLRRASAVQLTSVDAMLEGSGSTKRPLITTSGTKAYGDTGKVVVTEDHSFKGPPMMADFVRAEQNVLGSKNVKGMILRPSIVFGRKGGAIKQILEQSKASGHVEMVGKGENLLSFVHVDDVADLYLLMLENPQAGLLLNAVTEPFLSQRQVVEAISRAIGFGGKVRQKNNLLQTFKAFIGKGSMNLLGANTMRVSAKRARDLGWQPRPATTLFEDIEAIEAVSTGGIRREAIKSHAVS